MYSINHIIIITNTSNLVDEWTKFNFNTYKSYIIIRNKNKRTNLKRPCLYWYIILIPEPLEY